MLINSFIGKEVYIHKGPVKGRIGRVVGIGTDNTAFVVAEGSAGKVKMRSTDAISMSATFTRICMRKHLTNDHLQRYFLISRCLRA